jgi:hypothetical protein
VFSAKLHLVIEDDESGALRLSCGLWSGGCTLALERVTCGDCLLHELSRRLRVARVEQDRVEGELRQEIRRGNELENRCNAHERQLFLLRERQARWEAEAGDYQKLLLLLLLARQLVETSPASTDPAGRICYLCGSYARRCEDTANGCAECQFGSR